MKSYKITEERQVTQYWVFEVEANTESEALEAVLRGDIIDFAFVFCFL
jgi:hypothetical protein